MSLWLGITLGDPSGIGPEVALKALAGSPDPAFKYLLLGDLGTLIRLNKALGTDLPIRDFAGYSQDGRFFALQTGPALPEICERGSAAAAESAVSALVEGAQRSLRGEIEGIVTAPVNKESIIKLGRPFTGQTELLSDLAQTPRTAMMLLGADDRNRWLRVALVTTHLPLRDVARNITGEKIEQAIELASEACRDLGLSTARVAVCGLNPHAGEGGEMGDEEITTIAPAVNRARSRGLDVEGPIAADTLFLLRLPRALRRCRRDVPRSGACAAQNDWL